MVVDGVKRDLDKIRRRDPDLATSALAMLALSLAADMDNPRTSATARSMGGKTLQDTLKQLWAMVPAEEGNSRLDELSERRAQRRAAAAD